MNDQKHFEVERNGDVLIVVLFDPSDVMQLLVNELDQEMIELVENERPDRLLVDFQKVAFVPTAIINALLRVKKRIVTAGGTMKLCSLVKDVRQVFQVLNLEGTVFDIYDDRDAALKAF